MFLKCVVVLVSLLGAAMSMNLIQVQKKHQDVLYFETHEEQQISKIDKTVSLEAVVCPDGNECPDGNTCCKLATGDYGCCPLPDAVCCSDYVHCCPNGYICDVTAGTCNKSNVVINWMTKVAVKPVKEAVTCKDGSECPSGNTYCKLASGLYACCPLDEATCCSDHAHCCPKDYTCNVSAGTCTQGYTCSAGTCTQGTDVLSWLTKTQAKPVREAVECDDVSECPSGYTCCQLASGDYGCCPLEEAVCCSDHIHCCPNSYTCDLSTGACLNGNNVVSWLTKIAAKSKPLKEAVTCKDGSECPSGNTCCELASAGEYGCCPLEEAVCCSDHEHCCPKGYTCSVSAGTCTQGTDVLSWLTKTQAKPVREAVECDDVSECPSGYTCCQLASGDYGCCPLEEAVCCSDHIHCCPNSYTCDLSTGACLNGNNVVSWLTKIAAKPKPLREAVKCKDGSECPSGNTCCELASGQSGCCPLEKAVCCSDHVHCCPNGYTCDVSAGTCTQGTDVLGWLTKTQAKPAAENLADSRCLNGQTSCAEQSGQNGCCPGEKAICCSDQIHCCPDGYQCNVESKACTRDASVINWLPKQPSRPVKQLIKETVVCPNGEAFCPEGNSCCRMYPTEEYGCCPFPKAVCCFLHCCPEHYTCNNTYGTCDKGSLSLPWLSRKPAVPAIKNV